MARFHRKNYKSHYDHKLPFWKATGRYGFLNALKYEFKHPRKYPYYPIWFIPMIISMVLIAIISYFYSNGYLSFIFYLFEIIAIGYMLFRLLLNLNRIRIKGDLLRLWGLKILSGIISAIGIIIIFFVWIMFFIAPLEMLLNQESIISQLVIFGNEWNTPYVIPLFLEVIGIGLCFIGAYLLFKFKMRSGNVIWIGRF
jgi:hypothetical protein